MLSLMGAGTGVVLFSKGGSLAEAVEIDAAKAIRVDVEAEFEAEMLPLLERFCYDCHGDGSSKGDLVLDEYSDFETMLRDRGTWEEIMHQIDTKVMPPPKKKEQPSPEEREKMLGWIERSVFHFDCDHPDPGRVTLRRLNRAEYNNTIRDLVGVTFRPADDFPADDAGYGFDNIGDVLSLSPLLFEKYLAAGEKILGQAIRTVEPPRPVRSYGAEELRGGGMAGSDRVLPSSGEITAGHDFPSLGTYVVRVDAAASQAGDEPAKMAVRLDGKEVGGFEVPNLPDEIREYSVEVKVEKGGHRIDVAFLNDFYDPEAADQTRRDRNLFVRSVRIEGPLGVVLPVPEFQRRYLGEKVAEGDRMTVARKALEDFVLRAYRRPPQSGEIERLLGFLAVPEQSDPYAFEQGMKLAFSAVLASPHFLFRGEMQEQPDNPAGNYLIDEFALATRLSFFLWSTTPDDRLLELAGKGELRANLEAEIGRMMADAKIRALTENFAGQWLQLRNVELVSPDRNRFKDFDSSLARDMRRETEMVFERIVKEDRSVMDFLTADYSYVNERLAGYYGISGVKGGEFKLVSLKGTPRGGILTHASILTLTSNPTRTSPVKRGKWVLENILGTPPPEPPPNVPPLEERRRGDDAGETLRQRLEKHREDPNCAACHALMDPIGFAFENFDATGRWREKDGNAGIDSTGELVSGERFKDAADLRAILAAEKGGDFVRCMSERMLTYGLGRGLEFYDKCAVKEIVRRVGENDHRFSSMVRAVVDSVPFQYRRGDGERSYE
jgi:hypothetical protein